MSETKVVNFPKEKIVRQPNNLGKEKPKGFHIRQIEELLWRLEYEFVKGFAAGELDENDEFNFNKIMPIQRKDKKFTRFRVLVHPTELPF